jgi:hypothetical protein
VPEEGENLFERGDWGTGGSEGGTEVYEEKQEREVERNTQFVRECHKQLERVHLIAVQTPLDCWIHWPDHGSMTSEEDCQTQLHATATSINGTIN